jgi:hypothetical protein
MNDVKIVKKLNRLQKIQRDIGKRIDKSMARDDYTELLHLETMYKKIALQIAKLRQTISMSKTHKQMRGY